MVPPRRASCCDSGVSGFVNFRESGFQLLDLAVAFLHVRLHDLGLFVLFAVGFPPFAPRRVDPGEVFLQRLFSVTGSAKTSSNSASVLCTSATHCANVA